MLRKSKLLSSFQKSDSPQKKIQAFLFNWPGFSDKAPRLATQISRTLPLTVINSDDTVEASYPYWVHLGREAYFSEQFNTALSLFEGDILFHVQADVVLPDMKKLVHSALHAFRKYNAGIFIPRIDYTNWNFPKRKVEKLERKFFKVPICDSTCWFIDGSILKSFREVDIQTNKYGWGIDVVLCALCKILGKPIVCDYSLVADHPRRRGYCDDVASAQMYAYFQQLDPQVASTAQSLLVTANAILRS